MPLAHTCGSTAPPDQNGKTYLEKDVKTVYYLSAEFLIGLLSNNLINMGLYNQLPGSCRVRLDLMSSWNGSTNPAWAMKVSVDLQPVSESLATLEIPALG